MAVIDIIDIYIYNRQFQAIKGSLRKSHQLCLAERRRPHGGDGPPGT